MNGSIDRGELAKQLFYEGYNCAQAVVCAFEDVTGLDRALSAKLASSFGGGMGRMREVCGSVSGALMVLGMVLGYDDPKDPEAKKQHYRLVQEFAARFKRVNSSIVCRELLTGVKVAPGSDPEERTAEYYKKRPCPELIKCAAQIAGQMLEEEMRLDTPQNG